MEELKLCVPTYFGDTEKGPESVRGKSEFDAPHVPVLVYPAEGVRIVLGSHDVRDLERPDIQIERRPNGWAIFLHPLGGSDPSGFVYFLDDGRSFLVPELASGWTEPIRVVGLDQITPLLDRPVQVENPVPLVVVNVSQS